MSKQVYIWSAVGFVAGAVLGFVWSDGTKSRLSNSISTDFDNGKMTITLDAAGAIAGPLADLVRK
ncbi:MAG: hypothetical protein ACYCX5_12505 [Coriobacteriia bacterium]